MSLDICVLGSGSGGNSTLLRTPAGCLLIDAGFGPRSTQRRLAGTGVGVEQLRAVVLTHLDRDHFNRNWLATLVRFGIRVHCHESCVPRVLAAALLTTSARKLAGLPELVHGFNGQPFEPVPAVRFAPLHLAHDEAGSHGFVIASGPVRMGYATDLGRVPDELVERFCGVDVLALESNYDPEMEQNSARPWYLKQRIMGGRGHLSNPQAFAAVTAILDRTQARHGPGRLPRHIVLLHRSRECNCPALLANLFRQDPRIGDVLTLADQTEPTGWLRVGPPRAVEVQLPLLG